MGCSDSESPCDASNRRGRRLVAGVTFSRRSMLALLPFVSFAPTLDPFGEGANAPRPSCTKPTGRTFDLEDHCVRAAVCQALNNVAFAPSARSRGSAGPIRAEPLHCQFDVHVRRRPIGSYEVFFVLCYLVPDNLNVRRASRARKLVLPKSKRSRNAHHRAIPRP
jgi:hypothetical protein